MSNVTKKGWKFWGPVLVVAIMAAPMTMLSYAPVNAAEDEESPLEDVMASVSSAHKRMRRSITDASKKDANIGYVLQMQAGAVAAKSHAPSMAKSVPAAKRDAFVNDYKKGLNVLIKELLVLEEALMDGKMDAAKASYDKLAAIKKAGHDKFIEE